MRHIGILVCHVFFVFLFSRCCKHDDRRRGIKDMIFSDYGHFLLYLGKEDLRWEKDVDIWFFKRKKADMFFFFVFCTSLV